MPETVEIEGVELTVTTIDELTVGQKMATMIVLSKLKLAGERNDHQQVMDATIELFQMMIDEPIGSETLEQLPAASLREIAEVIHDE